MLTRNRIITLTMIIVVVGIIISATVVYFCLVKHEDSKTFLLIEVWHFKSGYVISGNASDIPFLCIDFPTYNIDETSRKLVDYGNLKNKDLTQTKIIIGNGSSISGDIGGGAASRLYTYNNFPIHIFQMAYFCGKNVFNYTLDIISNEEVLINNSINIPTNEQYSYYLNYTEDFQSVHGGNATVAICERIMIKNYGVWSKDAIQIV